MRKFNHDPRAVTRHRSDAKLTKTALAQRLGCSLSLVSEIEGGTRNAQPDLLERMAKIFDCPVSALQPRRTAEEAGDVDVPRVRHEERPAGAGHVPEVRDA